MDRPSTIPTTTNQERGEADVEVEVASRLHENRVNMRRNTRTCFQCGKPGHFVADCPEKVENKDG
jgi:hypothetical protein